jgi:hypothetical protein
MSKSRELMHLEKDLTSQFVSLHRQRGLEATLYASLGCPVWIIVAAAVTAAS